ncbi:mCG145173, partial [Mus musculus]
ETGAEKMYCHPSLPSHQHPDAGPRKRVTPESSVTRGSPERILYPWTWFPGTRNRTLDSTECSNLWRRQSAVSTTDILSCDISQACIGSRMALQRIISSVRSEERQQAQSLGVLM